MLSKQDDPHVTHAHLPFSRNIHEVTRTMQYEDINVRSEADKEPT